MLRAVLQEVDGSKIEGVPGLVLCRGGHFQSPVVGHPTLTPRVKLGQEPVPTVGPVPLVITRNCHVRHPCHQRLDLVEKDVPLTTETPADQGEESQYGVGTT